MLQHEARSDIPERASVLRLAAPFGSQPLSHDPAASLRRFGLTARGRYRNISLHMSAPRYDLEDRLIRFGAAVCRLTEGLPATAVGRHVALQIIRSGTSPFANYGEVQGAESRRDFIHKLGICVKELRETRAWLKFMTEMDSCAEEELQPVLRECDELLAILASSIRTARQNGRDRM